jgi:ketosteroid isomerase-like protein
MRGHGRSVPQLAEHRIEETPSDERVLTRMEVERLEAIRQGNTDALESLYAPEYTAVFSVDAGGVASKDHVRAHRGLGESRHLHLCELSDMQIRLYGPVGVVTARAFVEEMRLGKKRTVHSHYTHIWVKREGRWRLVHRHVHCVSPAGAPSANRAPQANFSLPLAVSYS